MDLKNYPLKPLPRHVGMKEIMFTAFDNTLVSVDSPSIHCLKMLTHCADDRHAYGLRSVTAVIQLTCQMLSEAPDTVFFNA